MNSNRGFTLIEVIIAMSISVLVASLAYQTLSISTETTERTSAAAKRIDDIGRAWQFIETDVRHALERSAKDSTGKAQPSLTGGENSDYLLHFVRGGWANPLQQPRSTLQRIGYVLEDNTLWRYYWFVVDGDGEEEPQRIDLLTKVKDVTVRFLTSEATSLDDSQWHPLWPILGSGAAVENLPIAVEITIELEDMGEITRLFAVASG